MPAPKVTEDPQELWGSSCGRDIREQIWNSYIPKRSAKRH